jgi:hypothetical protein
MRSAQGARESKVKKEKHMVEIAEPWLKITNRSGVS